MTDEIMAPAKQTTNEKIALSVSEAADLLGVSRPTVYTLIHRADFPAFKIGRRTVISRIGLEEWVQSQTVQHNSFVN